MNKGGKTIKEKIDGIDRMSDFVGSAIVVNDHVMDDSDKEAIGKTLSTSRHLLKTLRKIYQDEADVESGKICECLKEDCDCSYNECACNYCIEVEHDGDCECARESCQVRDPPEWNDLD